MESSVRLGRFAGIEIGVNWSWFVVFTLITWSLAAGVFPSSDPGLADGTYVVMGVVAALLFFASLLAHELGHAVVARREGMELDGITLWLFGGVARFKGMFPSAAAELKVALAGPLVSLVVGVVCSVGAWAVALPASVDGVVAWLGYANLILLAFNLVPALPLDGGRVLRALLWQARRDLAWATGIAASIGRGFGYLLIVGGLVLFVAQGAFGGAWLAFIGWFLLQAAGAERQQLVARQALRGLRVRDLMTPEPDVVTAGTTLGEFMDDVAWRRRHTTYPVVDDDGRVLGLLAFRSVAAVPRDEWDLRAVEQAAVPVDRVPVLRADQPALAAVAALGGGSVNRALVLEGGRLVGILSAADLSRALDLRPRAFAGHRAADDRIGASR